MLATMHVSPATFLAIMVAAALASAVTAVAAGAGWLVPAVVLELLLGVLIGPSVIGLQVTEFISFFSALGLGLLFFFVGYEIDLTRIRGSPARLALAGWALSLAIAYGVGAVLAAAGVVLSLLYTGSALSTTALGTLLPILFDSGQLRSRLGGHLMACGAVGEFGPIVLVTLILSAQSTLHNALILAGFIALSFAVAVVATRSGRRAITLFEQTVESSAQVAVRWILVLVFALALLAFELGLDLLLGGFAAGIIVRQVLKTEHIETFDSKLTAIGFGIFVPFFFIVSGMKLDVSALFSGYSGALKMLLFLALFLVVRGSPALLLYRRALQRRERVALALMGSTQLPLVLAITTLAREEGHMRASTAAALVGAAVLSTLIFPVLGMRQLQDAPRQKAR